MRIFGIHILTQKRLKEVVDVMVDFSSVISRETLNAYYGRMDFEALKELERLKQDHWDKEAFDRLIGRLTR